MNESLYGKRVASVARIRAAEEKAMSRGVTEDELIDKAATELAAPQKPIRFFLLPVAATTGATG